jgi:hypothetical protein
MEVTEASRQDITTMTTSTNLLTFAERVKRLGLGTGGGGLMMRTERCL